ncbi:MAG: heme oxygenase-domain-containing protein [Benjaminiella poitrasii]|nr:MAG: heme oxygenase-domain-containing protein [Benjaminiella poitrasii]
MSAAAVASKACPFDLANKETEVDIVNNNSNKQEAACPFATMGKNNDMGDMMTQSSVDHTITHEYDVKRSTINRYLPETQNKKGQEYLSNPQLASAMKEGTRVVHSAAENSVFTKRFLNGTITKAEYGRYINSLYFVYKTMEDLLNQYKDHLIVKMVYFPYELNRINSLIEDLEYYFGKDRVEELIDPKNATPAVKNYMKALKDAAEKNPALLIAHSYTRYLGDLSGGQILAKRLKKHVLKIDVTDLAWDSSEGLEFYSFKNIDNHAEFKNLYRSRLDNAHVTQYVKDLIVAEAIYSFELNIAIFDEIQALSDANELVPIRDELVVPRNKKNTVTTETASKKFLPNADWMVGFATGAATLAFGISLYMRISEKF